MTFVQVRVQARAGTLGYTYLQILGSSRRLGGENKLHDPALFLSYVIPLKTFS
jgi:hypothetical protein